MKRIFLVPFLIFTFFFCGSKLWGQQSNQNLYFCYIGHESALNINVICDDIKSLRDDCIEMGDAMIVYLANGSNPMISFLNLPDEEMKYTGDDIFDDIISALQESISHDVSPLTDLREITKLFETCQINDENLNLGYSSVTMDFYVGPQFWNLKNNESLLSRLYWTLDIKELKKKKLAFNVITPKGQEIQFKEGLPFGVKNIEGINQTRIQKK